MPSPEDEATADGGRGAGAGAGALATARSHEFLGTAAVSGMIYSDEPAYTNK